MLREQLDREKQENETQVRMIEQRDNNIIGLRGEVQREKDRGKRLENEIHELQNTERQLRENIMDEKRRLRQREEDIESLEGALNDLKESMIKEIEHKTREFDALKRAYDDTFQSNENLRQVVSNLTVELDTSHSLI